MMPSYSTVYHLPARNKNDHHMITYHTAPQCHTVDIESDSGPLLCGPAGTGAEMAAVQRHFTEHLTPRISQQ